MDVSVVALVKELVLLALSKTQAMFMRSTLLLVSSVALVQVHAQQIQLN
jgi:hypothetical protein